MGVGDPEDLLPCPPALTKVGKVVKREQLPDAIATVPSLSTPLLVHASGGMGKTVFMDSLASGVSENSEVVFFDCFGGGAYRSPEDARHLPKKGLIHIANTLAFRGLCDPILPDATDVESLLRTFRRRLTQCVSTVKRVASGRELVLLIDAIDNAELIAQERNERAFPSLLLESLHHTPIPGVKLIVSCRTERKPSIHAPCQELDLRPFTIDETTAYLRPRLKKVSQAEINVAQSRSGGNPRVLEYLVKSDRSLLDKSEIHKGVELDDLIQQRLSDALDAAFQRGNKQEDTDAFLAGLAILPPPVPLDEYAGAHGMEQSAIESFAADLRPLLERTNQGLMFRDEPTETLVRNRYGSLKSALRRVAENLSARQDTSVYAARALPSLLQVLDEDQKLFELAFDDRMPQQITSTVGKRNIRHARIKAAVLHAAIKGDYNRLVQLIVELSTLAAVDQRGTSFILDYPDLVVAAHDVDAKRRLFETKTGWPGARHARLAIANSLAGDFEEAYRHAIATDEWFDYYRRDDRDNRPDHPRPEACDVAAVPFFLVCENRPQHAVHILKGWKDWYVFEVCEYIFDYSLLAVSIQTLPQRRLMRFIDALTDIGPLTAALSFQEFSKQKRKELVRKLSQACRKSAGLDSPRIYQGNRAYQIQDGLRMASALALSLGMTDQGLSISALVPQERLPLWSLRSNLYDRDVFSFVFRTALLAAAKNKVLHEKDILPKELVPICSRINKSLTGIEFRHKVKERLPKYVSGKRAEQETKKDQHRLNYDQKQEAEDFIDHQLQPLLDMTKALASFLAASPRSANSAFIELLRAWENARKSHDAYETHRYGKLFQMLGLDATILALRVRSDLNVSSIKRFLATAHGQELGAYTLIQIVSILARRKGFHALAGEQALQARKSIEAENDVTHRANLLASLGKAILPASIDEASAYFRYGLEQMDAIGSGDYEFTNELLLFASSIKGNELEERDFHTLTNICELNMGDEPEKFFWGAFARGLSKAAGPRGLAKLSRWDDRSKIRLSYTLLPYLIALVNDGKIEPELALALNRLADPAEYWNDGTSEFAKAIESKGGTARPEVISELIKQFEDNNPEVAMHGTVQALASLAEQTFGRSSETTAYLSAAQRRFAKVNRVSNIRLNYTGEEDARLSLHDDDQLDNKHAALKALSAATDPTDQDSLVAAIKELNSIDSIWKLKGEFFSSLRRKVPFDSRTQYVRNISELEHFNFYWKLEELKECKEKWGMSSAALRQTLKDAAIPLTLLHADDLVDYGRSKLREISDLTDVPIGDLVLELVKILARPKNSASGAIWLAIASLISSNADDGQAQKALKRLLASEAAKLADNVTDGPWEDGLYPEDNVQMISASLVWRMLGSPHAEDRWRAAHSVRCLARFRRWNVVDALVDKFTEETAGPFQARELTFYYLHARLWLLIASARMALDHPDEIARYKDLLLSIATDTENPHVLMRHFSARALLACIDLGSLVLPEDTVKQLRCVDLSPHPQLKERVRQGGGFYHSRPAQAPKPKFEFGLDYDFHKYAVSNLSEVFGRPLWEVADMISEVVHQLDPKVSSMYDPDGRWEPYRHSSYGMTTRYHSWGQQLGWHALFLVAGKLLNNFPVTQHWLHEDDPWGMWLGRHLLSREDGLWLSDGTDRTPLDTLQILLEKAKGGLGLTGDRDKLLSLAGLSLRLGKKVVVQGSWHSADNIEVHISSALVPPQKAGKLARKLMREKPMLAWVPAYHESEDDIEYSRGNKKEYIPWVFTASAETRLDEHDPFGTPYANSRSRLARDFISTLALKTNDPFRRYWLDKRGKRALEAQAWGRESQHDDRGPHPGGRLYCSTTSLKRILKDYDKSLLMLISLQRYEKKGYREAGKFTHTVAALTISKTLDLEYFKGRVNYLHESRY